MLFRLLTFFFIFNAFCAEKPAWINNPDTECFKLSELCSVGIGTSRSDAIRSAKVEMAKIFSTKISAEFTGSLKTNVKETNEELQENIKEETQGILEGVQVKKIFDQNDGFYVQVTLDKKKASEGIKLKITDLDNEIKSIYEDNRKSGKIQLKKLFVKRQALNQNYLFLTGSEITSPIASDLIFKSSKESIKGVLVHIHFEEKEPKQFEAATIKFFTDMGFKVTTGTTVSELATNSISGKVISEKQFLSVAGFKKYKVILKVSASNIKKHETGHLNLEATETGRNYQQAYELAEKDILNDLKDKIIELNIE
jgi:hypothetical protein